ncbi:MAG: hypothetical protein L0J91_03815 [Lactococcus lactis]|nr:hypothetical protein [Lactococcus lactis]
MCASEKAANILTAEIKYILLG